MAGMGMERHAGGEQPVRHFLMLQMPCGSFGSKLQRSIRASGRRCTRVAFNGGDVINSLSPFPVLYRRSIADWPAWVAEFAAREGVTDLICYGDCRTYHKAAIETLKPMGIAIHVLEEGYLRPNWVTCESDGVNGHSALARIDLDRVKALPVPPNNELKLRASPISYCFSGFFYYTAAMVSTGLFPRWENHRDLDIVGESALWLERLFLWPFRRARTERALRAIDKLEKPFHLVLLQLNGDSQIKVHSDFKSVRHFVEYCVAEFAASGTPDQLLVFKNHPLDNGVINLEQVIREEAERHGLDGRVFFVETGKLVPLLEQAVSATAVNSTACHQALLRGIPTMVLGRAVFNHPQIVPRMRLADFFRMRPCKNRQDYLKLVSLMRHTCQFNGGYYTAEGQRILIPGLTRALIDGMPGVAAYLTPEEMGSATKQAS